MRQVVSVAIGGGPCSKDCPYYAEEGWVRDVNGIPVKTHCRGTMQKIVIDCDKFTPSSIGKMTVTDEQWQSMQAAIGKRAKKERKPYPEDHKVIHPIGFNWKHDRWNAEKSLNVKH